jgi:hypothetical protein
MKKYLFVLFAAIVTFFTQCDTIKNLPTNTSGGLFSLNGNWQLTSSSDNRSLEGTVVSVVPGFSEATARTLNNNNYCLRDRDVVWRAIKSGDAGVFAVESLVNACSGATVYKQGTITVLTNDEIRLVTQTASSTELVQTWKRVASPQGQ